VTLRRSGVCSVLQRRGRRIEVGEEDLPADEHELDEFRGRLLEASERWARQYIADRHVEVEGV